MNAFFYGFTVGLSLILAIGAQNAFVLKQGLKNQHIFWVCLICSLSDAILITLGVTGFAKVVEHNPAIITIAKYLGAAFLFWYGFTNFKSSFTKQNALIPSEKDEHSLAKIIIVCLSFTWLNPHVYLDTLVLIGSISTQFPENKMAFTFGTALASVVFFFSLGYGAKFLRPIFEKPKAWHILEFIIGIMMWLIAISLLFYK